ncbi:phage major capsid protein [Quadrisphaera sp. INWT6]|uniref:phage major capsid protein n=1 Tax=Quadrisphaera sp. INWT6 TaxID=2596917 RepID=UPI0018926F40|nr:phage major capsid protein [Quadrisphaera sp. INWT6]
MATTVTASGILKPEDVRNLILLPLQTGGSVALNPAVSTLVTTDAQVSRFPRVTDAPIVGWISEAAPLPVGDLEVDEVIVVPSKVGSIVPITSELEEDAEYDPLELTGTQLVDQAGQALDDAFLGDLPSPAPLGLASLVKASGSGVQAASAGGSWKNLDVFAQAGSLIEGVGGRMTAVLANPADVLAISTLKAATGSNQALLSPGGDPAQPSRRQVEGVPLLSHRSVPAGTAWAVDSSRIFTVIRRSVRLELDRSVYRSTDRTAVVLTMRAGFGFTDDRAVVKISKA